MGKEKIIRIDLIYVSLGMGDNNILVREWYGKEKG